METEKATYTEEFKNQYRGYIKYKAYEKLNVYTKLTFPKYQFNWHHREIADHLEAVERGEITRLFINIPPRFGKSELTSVRFPAWYLGRHNERKVILASYSDTFARTLGRQTRNLVRSPYHQYVFPDCTLMKDSTAVSYWELVSGGRFMTVGRGGAVTGHGAHLIVVDDLYKNIAEAYSPVIRENAWEWFRSTLYTRLEKDGAIVIANTRWHEEDICGKLEAETEQKYVQLKIPVQAEKTYHYARHTYKKGEVLWPERFNEAAVKDARFTLGTHFEALYQQNPATEKGKIFNRRDFARRLKSPPANVLMRCITGDTAFGENSENDYSALGEWQILPNGLYLANVLKERMAFPLLCRTTKDWHEKVNPEWSVFEDKASGLPLIQQMREETGFPIVPFFFTMKKLGHDIGKLSKIARAGLAQGMVQAGLIILPEKADWVEDFINEVTKFPTLEHDDLVDMMVIMLLFYMRFIRPRLIKEGKVKETATGKQSEAGTAEIF